MSIFEIASREKYRFPSTKGDLTTEQLWDLPLESAGNVSLDNVARTINNQLKSETEESFVTTRVNTRKTVLERKLEIVKYIIGVRIAENEEAKRKRDNKAERDRLTEILASKRDKALEGLSETELQKRIAELA